MWCLLFLLLGLIELQTDDNSERLRVQITVPEKIRSASSGGVETHVSYNIVIEGKTYTVNLMQKVFLPHNFRVYGYNGTGSMKPLEQQFQNLCYYQGYIEGYPNSMVIVSTCTGLRGLLQFENVSYGIEPLEPSIGFEHVIYQVKHRNTGASLYAEKDIESREKPYKIQSVEPPADFSQYIEMHVVVEKNLYNHMGSDTTVVTQKIFQLIGLTNAIFDSFNITIILSSLELWIDENKIQVTGDASELLHRFLKWKRSYLVLRPHDVAFLLVYREKPNYVGATFQGRLCDKYYGGGVALHPRTISLESLAVIIAQLLSLSMGITYDDINKCHCPGAVCVMNPQAIHSSGVKIFSNCSMEDFTHFISKSQCLQNQPRLGSTYKVAVCGNGKVEEGEQCDCGNQEACAALPDSCCNQATCTLNVGSACAAGPCCDACAFTAKGQVCRASTDECDLSEYCNGTSAACQEDLYVQDGHPCAESQWICVNGKCMNGIKQCLEIFGEGSGFGTQECFDQLNSKTDPSGNCGSNASGYTQCNPKYVCKNKKCVDSSFLNYDCTPEKCHNQGLCNNKRHCHCNPTYLPPNCQVSLESWEGGSIDSGNFPPSVPGLPDRRYIENVYYSTPTRWPFFLVIPFFIILCVLIATLVKVYFQRKKWRTEDYTSDEQVESESETKD
ncbi:PREDICTED: disintegrin and metalloproteinase domain-containing protein 2-like isoform X3 [Lipotes vexillifer]|uniref:Disintegrin and metalloproteinase domain-containing protein 2 n=1 Tax=Lipotes vexillifer TaxID=118797 RepID=A0A340WT47_LIPVE|nr:PREDICTED: disintegrin and metalloproteinase domain-containing protein 2-like isoform X3 [Lipotes vexillifer]